MNISRVLLLAGAGGLILLAAACSPAKTPAPPPPPIKVQAVMPARHVFHAPVAAFGQLVADSRQALSLSLPQAGQVTTLDVIAGQRVTRGTVLLELTTNPTTRSAYLQAQAGLKSAQEDLARTEHLRSENLATNGQVVAARKALIDAQATLRAQAKLGGGQPQTALKAPATGVITALTVYRGQRVAAGTGLLQFTPDAALVAQLTVDPGSVGDIKTAMAVSLNSVYAAPGVRPLRGAVALVGGAVDPLSRRVNVMVTLDAPASLPAGTALSATIHTTPIKAWAMPRDALQSDAQGSYVFQIEQGKAQRVGVKVVAPTGSPIGVDGALDPDAPVITLGSYGLSAGDAVKAQPHTAAKP